MGLGKITVLGDTAVDVDPQTQAEIELEKLRKIAEPIVAGETTLAEDERTRLLARFAQAYAGATGGSVAALQFQIGLWRRKKGFKSDWENVPEKLMLTVTELSEAMEAFRHLDPAYLELLRGAPDGDPAVEVPVPQELQGSIPWLENFEEEMADVFIRLCDLCDALGLDLEGAIHVKMGKNELREFKHGKNC